MIKKMAVEDIAKILTLEDDIFETLFPCDKGQLVQFLIQNIDNPKLFIMGGFRGEKLTGYLIAIDSVVYPFCDEVTVLYSKTAGIDKNRKILKKLKEWAKENKANGISFVTNNVKGHLVYGFKKKATVMYMEI